MEASAVRIILGLVLAVTCMVLWPRFVKINSFFSLLFASILFALIAGIPVIDIIPIMQTGFGNLLQQIGLIIALGSVLGTLLEKTGAMEAISLSLLQVFGKGRPVLAVSVIGALVGIPVFCDSGFIILSKLIPSLAVKTAASPGAMVLALSSGLYTTHVLVPPTPGPLAAAATFGLGDQLGMVMLVSLLGSIPVVLVSYFYAIKAGLKISPVQEISVQSYNKINWLRACLPLILPVLLIAGGSLTKMIGSSSPIAQIISVAGIPAVALLIGILLAITLVDRRSQPGWHGWITEALKDAGIIILITGAGGAFGALIKSSGVDALISEYVSGSAIGGGLFLTLAWSVAAVIKTAQGSSTSSMIITSALMAPMMVVAGFSSPLDQATLVIAVGGGAFVVSHANDSYFWVVSQFGGISAKDAFSRFTPMTFIQGITALIVSIILFYLL